MVEIKSQFISNLSICMNIFQPEISASRVSISFPLSTNPQAEKCIREDVHSRNAK